MTKSKRPVLQVAMNEDQDNLLDAVLEIVHSNRYNKTSFVLEAIRREARGFISLPDDISITDEKLYDLVIDRNEQNVISIIGQEKYDEFWKEKEGEKNE